MSDIDNPPDNKRRYYVGYEERLEAWNEYDAVRIAIKMLDINELNSHVCIFKGRRASSLPFGRVKVLKDRETGEHRYVWFPVNYSYGHPIEKDGKWNKRTIWK